MIVVRWGVIFLAVMYASSLANRGIVCFVGFQNPYANVALKRLKHTSDSGPKIFIVVNKQQYKVLSCPVIHCARHRELPHERDPARSPGTQPGRLFRLSGRNEKRQANRRFTGFPGPQNDGRRRLGRPGAASIAIRQYYVSKLGLQLHVARDCHANANPVAYTGFCLKCLVYVYYLDLCMSKTPFTPVWG